MGASREADTVEPSDSGYCESLKRRFLKAQLASDRRSAMQVLIDDGIRRGIDVRRLLQEVIRPAQQEIGQLWQSNAISVADEHVATAISQLALAQLYPLGERKPDTGRRILVACVEGELHDMGARIAADLLDLEGHSVVFLGASVPTDHLVRKIRDEHPDLVVLTVTMTFHSAALVDAVTRIRAEVTPAPAIAAGGRALGWCPELTGKLKLAAHGEDARTLLSDVQRFFRR